MSGFDTSGAVEVTAGRIQPALYTWSDLTPFQQGYVEALFASIEDRDEEGEPQILTEPQAGPPPYEAWYVTVAFSDLSPEALARIMADCERYENPVMAAYVDAKRATAGRHFWEQRQTSGGWMTFPPLTPFLSEDGKIHLREPSEAPSRRGV